MIKKYTRFDIVTNHNIMVDSPRKSEFVGTDKYDNEEFVKVSDIVKELESHDNCNMTGRRACVETILGKLKTGFDKERAKSFWSDEKR